MLSFNPQLRKVLEFCLLLWTCSLLTCVWLRGGKSRAMRTLLEMEKAWWTSQGMG